MQAMTAKFVITLILWKQLISNINAHTISSFNLFRLGNTTSLNKLKSRSLLADDRSVINFQSAILDIKFVRGTICVRTKKTKKCKRPMGLGKSCKKPFWVYRSSLVCDEHD